jgi:TRAP-type C4-dicarboxylate transport system permease small subunit
MAVAGIVGALAAVFTLPEAQALTRGFVLSALPAPAARAAAIVSCTAGLALVAASVPAMADILRDDPLRRRLLAGMPDDADRC